MNSVLLIETKAAYLASPKLVIFDCDGVIVDSVMAHCEVLALSFAKYGLNLTPEQCRDELGSGKMTSIGNAATRLGAQLPHYWIDEIYSQIYTRLEQGVPLIEGVVAVLDHLDSLGIPYCVASNGSEEKMAIMLEGNGVFNRLEDAIFSAHTIGSWKPDPKLFQHAADTMRVSPKDCIVIEDSITGVIAAKRAQMACLAYTPESDGKKLSEQGAVVFRSMKDLPGFL